MENSTQEIFSELFKSIERLGVQGTIRQLKMTDNVSKDNLEAFILKLVCDELKISKREVCVKQESHSTKKKNAHILLSFLMYKFTSLSQREIGEILNRTKATVNRSIKEVEDLNPKLKSDRELLVVLEKLEDEITVIKTKLN